MADKIITLPEDTVNVLLKIKKKDETITEALIRIIGAVAKKEKLLEWVEKREKNEELAAAIESAYVKREEWKTREFS